MDIERMQAEWRRLRDEADAAIARRDELAERIAWEQVPFKRGDLVKDEKGRRWLVVGVGYWDEIDGRVSFSGCLACREITRDGSLGRGVDALNTYSERLEKVEWTDPGADRAEKGEPK